MSIYIPYKLRVLHGMVFRQRQGAAAIRASFRHTFGRELDDRHPRTFSEKLYTRLLRVNERGDPTFTRLSDKLQVRLHVASRVGAGYLVPLLWSGAQPEDIPFADLPSRCMIKTNHGSGGNVAWGPGTTKEEVIHRMKKSLKENFYWVSREYHYHAIPRRILIEPLLEDGFSDGPLDYRFWCFNGVPEVIQVDNHAHDINPFFDRDWNALSLHYRRRFQERQIPKPEQLAEMLEVASSLAAEFDFVRVDLYNIRGQIYFGELTFTPVAGKFRFSPSEWDLRLGDKWSVASPKHRPAM